MELLHVIRNIRTLTYNLSRKNPIYTDGILKQILKIF
ncbi:MAG: hypothetical protein K0S53_1283 [Bacteroidetes bacterium]|jgi:hypothetical protein|nr:hypothetical protein [Bacteroidota bacterium]